MSLLNKNEEFADTGEPFWMYVEDVFGIKGRGTVVTGRVRTGVVKPGDEIDIVGSDERLRTTVTALSMFNKKLTMARAGENVGVLLQGIKRDQVKPGMVLQSPGLEPTSLMKELKCSECGNCHKTFRWDDAYKCQDTPGSALHTLYNYDYMPRAFCPHCGALVIEWHITKEKDFDEWTWFGENKKINAGRPLPDPPMVYGWGIVIPPEFLPTYDEHRLDIERIKQSAALSRVPADSEVDRAIKSVPDLDPRTASLDAALFMAAHHGVIEAVDILLRAGANPNYKAPSAWTPLLMAASNGHVEAVKALLEMGADPNDQDVFAAHTPLILAALDKHVEVVKTLLKAGADVNRRNNWGHTALGHAKRSGNAELEEILTRAGAILE